jgi:hypothetical protein
MGRWLLTHEWTFLQLPIFCQCQYSHENVVSLMATPAQSFLDTYHDQIKELKHSFMIYVKSLCASDLSSKSGNQCDVAPTRLLMTNDGCPILPAPWKGSEYKKKELEEWFMLYVGQHYSMLTILSPSHYLSAYRTGQQWS